MKDVLIAAVIIFALLGCLHLAFEFCKVVALVNEYMEAYHP